jgi:hypothetical protein
MAGDTAGWQTGKVRIELNTEGIRELLLSERVSEELEVMGNRVSAAADARYAAIEVGARDVAGVPGHITTKVIVGRGERRARIRVVAEHPAARAVEARDRVLGQAMDAANG